MRVNKSLLFAGLFLVACLAGLQIWMGMNPEPGNTLSEKPQGAPFTLQSQAGAFSLTDLEDDQLALIYFGYTWCPDICPMSMTFMSRALELVPQELRQDLQPIFISVDPARDTPERLAAYVDFFEANILGLTGEPEYLRDLAQKYGVFYQQVELDSAMGYAIDHTSEFYLVNNQGQLLQTLNHSNSGRELAEALTTALQNPIQ
ncbi:SCO family protein [Marinospirillum perlucidum]|uniref:SCO family protein n=1 Tax=Marinospirillum perlucidum TaxID=1982602 RepID=UPI000DF1646B|nr:SCO family protein [Marinospirillum perlucidum]